jgi:hypothetical protein
MVIIGYGNWLKPEKPKAPSEGEASRVESREESVAGIPKSGPPNS